MDYIRELLMDPDMPENGKSLLLKLYGVNQSHLLSALECPSDLLRASVYNHKLCDESFLDKLAQDPSNLIHLSQIVFTKPGLFNPSNIKDFYEKAFDWSHENPDEAKELLMKLHNLDAFGGLPPDILEFIKEKATSDHGRFLGLNSFFPDPSEPPDDALILYPDPNSEVTDQTGARVKITQFPNGSDSGTLA